MADFDPYYTWLGIPPAEQPPDYYRLLALARFESDSAVISNAADQRLAFLRTKQNGPRAAESQRLLNEISRAIKCLLDPENRAAYDARLGVRTPAAPTAPQNVGRSDIPVPKPPPLVRRDLPVPHSSETMTSGPAQLRHRLQTQISRVKLFFGENRQYAILGVTLAVALTAGTLFAIAMATRRSSSEETGGIDNRTPTTNEPTTNEPTTNEPTTNEPTTNEPTTNQAITDGPVPKNAVVNDVIVVPERNEPQTQSTPRSTEAKELETKQSSFLPPSTASSPNDTATTGTQIVTNDAARMLAKRRAKAFPKIDVQFAANKETWPPESKLPKVTKPRPSRISIRNQGYPRPTQEKPIILDGRRSVAYADLFRWGGEAQFEFRLTREEGNGGLALAFPFGTSTCVLVLDEYTEAGPFSGLDMVRGYPVFHKENPTSVYGAVLETGKCHRLKVVSLRNRVFVDLDGKRLVDFEGPSTDVAGSSLVYPSEPRRAVLRASGGLFSVQQFQGKGAWFISGAEALPAGTVTQIPGAGGPNEKPKFAASFGGTLAFETTSAPVLDFKEPFTFELWFRNRDLANKRFQLLNGCIRVEFRWEPPSEQTLGLANPGSGTHGPLASFDTNWHHLAVCNDRYYVELFLDGKFVARSPSTYFIREQTAPIEIGFQPSRGSRIREFRGEVRDVRVSSIARYPRSQSFTPPEVLAWDAHSTLRLDLSTNPPNVQSSMSRFGNLSLYTNDVKFVPLD